MSTSIDLNLDAGEIPEALASGKEEALYQLVSSVNIACGGHAGDERSMRAAVRLARKYGLAIGAHPSFPDRENFGRKVVAIELARLTANLVEQVRSLQAISNEEGMRLHHLKAHGALYNEAARDNALAEVLIETVQRVDPNLILVGLAGSPFLDRARSKGLRVAAEAFVDRRYEADGSLRARRHADALITDLQCAAAQALGLARGEGVETVNGNRLAISVQTLCIHGDGADSLAIAKAVRDALEHGGIQIKAID